MIICSTAFAGPQDKSKKQDIDITGRIPKIEVPVKIDGDLSEWKTLSFTDGVWDIFRVSKCSWFCERNRLTRQNPDDMLLDDLSARYYTGWDEKYMYFGAEVKDNFNDVNSPPGLRHKMCFMDAVAWYLEMPADDKNEKFDPEINCLWFIADADKPEHGAFWRHSIKGKESYIFEPMPENAVEYEVTMNPWNRSKADYIIEGKVEMAKIFKANGLDFKTPKTGDIYRMMIVHTDPDGGDYGGHLLIYGSGDKENTWGKFILSEKAKPIQRKEE